MLKDDIYCKSAAVLVRIFNRYLYLLGVFTCVYSFTITYVFFCVCVFFIFAKNMVCKCYFKQ